MTLQVQDLAWDRNNNMAGLNLVNEISTPPLLIIGTPTAIHI